MHKKIFEWWGFIERSPMCPVTWFYYMTSRGPSNLNLAGRCSTLTSFSPLLHTKHIDLFTNTETDCLMFCKWWHSNKKELCKTLFNIMSFIKKRNTQKNDLHSPESLGRYDRVKPYVILFTTIGGQSWIKLHPFLGNTVAK